VFPQHWFARHALISEDSWLGLGLLLEPQHTPRSQWKEAGGLMQVTLLFWFVVFF